MKGLIGVAILITLLPAGLAGATDAFLVRNGQPEAVIVPGGGEFNGFVARELQRYIETLSGARLEIAAAAPKGKPLVLVGGHAAAVGLKDGGYVLKRATSGGQPALVVSGNDEAGTMYAAYDLLERLGFVFLLTKDIVPSLVQPAPVYLHALGMAVFSTVLPVFMTSAAIRRIGASKTALIGTLGPILTIFFGVWLLDEPLTWWQMGGAVLVLAGVMLISKISIRPGFMGLMDRTFLLYKK